MEHKMCTSGLKTPEEKTVDARNGQVQKIVSPYAFRISATDLASVFL